MGSDGFLAGSFFFLAFGFGMAHHARAILLSLAPQRFKLYQYLNSTCMRAVSSQILGFLILRGV